MAKQEDVVYTKTHEWIFIEGETATIGISDHAQKEMGDIVFVELPKVGQKIEKGKTCAVIESVKSAFDIYASISGEVTEINDTITNDPSLANSSPMEDGWMFKMKISDRNEANDLMDFSAYQDFVKQNA